MVFRDDDDVVLLSRSGKDLGRYFPEVLDAVRDELAPRCVLDGEIVVPRETAGRTRLDWETLSQRIHPAQSRIAKLSVETPAHFIGFDALALGDRSLLSEPFRGRRAALLDAVHEKRWCHVTRTTEDPALGTQWLQQFEGAGLDGVIAKRLDGTYLPGKREMVKVKHHRDADCVAIGYRIHKSGAGIGSILLGLYREDGELQMVGGAASFTAKARLSLLAIWSRCARAMTCATVSRAGGIPLPTSAGSRSARNGCARWPMTRWKAAAGRSGSGTR